MEKMEKLKVGTRVLTDLNCEGIIRKIKDNKYMVQTKHTSDWYAFNQIKLKENLLEG